jgi:hypothetical protein
MKGFIRVNGTQENTGEKQGLGVTAKKENRQVKYYALSFSMHAYCRLTYYLLFLKVLFTPE